MEDSAGQAAVGVTKAFLPLLDNLERAAGARRAFLPLLDNLERAAGAYTCQTEGEKRVMDEYKKEEQEFLEVLRSNGIDMVESLGQVFDPRVHEGVTMRESEEYEDGVVCTQLQRGYKVI
ncbi:GrpE-domain-containing protein [Baffinella frigidus]|nr:GrpE-domain-containing protein [Cryptophyta sp. CCMP2293]